MECKTAWILVGVILSSLALFFNTITLISASTETDNVENLNWAYGSGGGFDYYSGVYNIIAEGNGVTSSADFDSNNCIGNFCKECDGAMQGAIAFVVFTWLLNIPALVIDFLRFRDISNTPMNRWIMIILDSLVLFCCALSMIIAGAGCVKHLERDTSNISWHYGPSFGLMMTVFVFKLIDLVCNICYPVSDGVGTTGAPDNRM